MRLLVTADLHFNHPRSRPLAEELIERMNNTGGDVLLLVGDTAAADGDQLEQCLGRFRFSGPKLFVAGNHELWTGGPESYSLFHEQLPRRVRAMDWRWLQTDPFSSDGIIILGSIGWYDYAFAPAALQIPRRFYEQKVSPGAAERLPQFAALLEGDNFIPAARQVVARWNDGKFVKLGRSDDQFLEELLRQLESQLAAAPAQSRIIVATHHLPFEHLLPPSRGVQWDFARAFLGSPRLGELMLQFPNVSRVFCGHSHFPVEAQVGHIHAVNIGSGYRSKGFITVDL